MIGLVSLFLIQAPPPPAIRPWPVIKAMPAVTWVCSLIGNSAGAEIAGSFGATEATEVRTLFPQVRPSFEITSDVGGRLAGTVEMMSAINGKYALRVKRTDHVARILRFDFGDWSGAGTVEIAKFNEQGSLEAKEAGECEVRKVTSGERA